VSVDRGFEENSDRIQINTDLRSRKIEELKHCPFSEMCWYFSDTWEQFRINGRIEVIDASNPDQTKLQVLCTLLQFNISILERKKHFVYFNCFDLYIAKRESLVC
jgi:hypothetical protein